MDKLIIGAGLYGLYAALYCAKKGQQVEVLEMEEAPFTRATYINQARVHMGYHYPRSLSTAMKSAGYFKRFTEDYSFCLHTAFQQIYATSAHFSWTDAAEFLKFCRDGGIPCKALPVEEYFQPGLCDGAFLTEEYTYDAHILRDHLMEEIAKYPGVKLHFGRQITEIVKQSDCYEITALHEDHREVYRAPFVLNATYASVNQVLEKVKGVTAEPFGLKYELCEIILCNRIRQATMLHRSSPAWGRTAISVEAAGWGIATTVPADRRVPGSICLRWPGNICGRSIHSAMSNHCSP